MAALLESIYEQDFHEFSYGFRPGRGTHQALRDIRQGLQSRIHHVIDCDISAFFDHLQHHKLLEILRKRVKDGRVLKLIESWLKAGIMDDRELVFPEKGSPQGSVISPLLANVYLREVLDTWFAEVVTEHCRGKVVMYRYADDFVGEGDRSMTDRLQTVLDLPPGPGNPRNSEGDMLRLADGRIVLVYTHFTGSDQYIGTPCGGRRWMFI